MTATTAPAATKQVALKNGEKRRAAGRRASSRRSATVCGPARSTSARQDDRTATTVWEFPKPTKGEHPTVKPVGVFQIPIQNHTQPGEIVYEPFAGSGSQIIAAEQLGRRCFALRSTLSTAT